MRTLIGLVLIAAFGWSAFWWFGPRAVDDQLRGWLDQQARSGWVANYSGVATRGFPNRFDTTISDLELADPATGVAWTAPFFSLLRLSYKPDHIIAVWPRTQTVASPNQRIEVQSDSARASLVFKPSTDFELDRSSFVFKGISLISSAGWTASIAEGLLASRPSVRTPGAIDIGFEAKNMRPANAALAKLAEAGVVPGNLEQLKIDASVGFDAPWDRQAIETRRPQVTELDLNLLQLRWGQLDLWAAGELVFDARGRASGLITIKARNWRQMFQLAVASGWVPDAIQPTLESGLSLLAGLSGPRETLDAPLTFTNGKVSFGPIPLGTLPNLNLR